jgi:predicted nucleic acid-binding protein
MAKKTKKIVLLDTNIIISLLRGEKTDSQIIAYLGYEKTAISTLSVLEIYYEMFKNEEKDTKIVLNKFNKIHLDKESYRNNVSLFK